MASWPHGACPPRALSALLHAGAVPSQQMDAPNGATTRFTGLVLMTASLEDGVLPGLMRARVLQAAAMLGLSVQEQAPCWQEQSAWLEMFVSNALRGVQPVASVMMPGAQGGDHGSVADAGVFELPQACGPVTQALQHLVLTLPNSTPIQLQ